MVSEELRLHEIGLFLQQYRYSVLHICTCKGTFFYNSAFHDKIHYTFSLTSVHQRFIKGCWRSSFPNCPQSLKLPLSFFCLIDERYPGYRQYLYGANETTSSPSGVGSHQEETKIGPLCQGEIKTGEDSKTHLHVPEGVKGVYQRSMSIRTLIKSLICYKRSPNIKELLN